MTIRLRLAFSAVFLLALLSWSVQAQTPPSAIPISSDQWANTAEHLTLSGGLIVAVSILWRELGRKDGLLLEAARKVTEALAIAAASEVELRKILEASVTSSQQFSRAVELLTERIERLPCTEVVSVVKGLKA